jgi:hypothetical protein
VIAFTIGGVKTGGQRGFQEVVTHIANAGNTLVKPKGSVTVLSKQGRVLQVLTFKMDTFLPQTAIDYPLLLKKALPPGDYTAKVQLSIPGVSGAAAKLVTARQPFSISKQDVRQVFTSAAPQTPPPGAVGATTASKRPWPLLGAAAGGVVVLLLLLWLFLRRRNRKTRQRLPTVVLRSVSAAAAEAAAPPVVPAEPAPAAAPFPAPVSERTAPPPAPTPPAAAPVPAPTPVNHPPECDPHHFWEVAYERGALGEDGVWRFPHHCRNCGLELLASDVGEATTHADARG